MDNLRFIREYNASHVPICGQCGYSSFQVGFRNRTKVSYGAIRGTDGELQPGAFTSNSQEQVLVCNTCGRNMFTSLSDLLRDETEYTARVYCLDELKAKINNLNYEIKKGKRGGAILALGCFLIFFALIGFMESPLGDPWAALTLTSFFLGPTLAIWGGVVLSTTDDHSKQKFIYERELTDLEEYRFITVRDPIRNDDYYFYMDRKNGESGHINALHLKRADFTYCNFLKWRKKLPK